jgi:hypothetical protein
MKVIDGIRNTSGTKLKHQFIPGRFKCKEQFTKALKVHRLQALWKKQELEQPADPHGARYGTMARGTQLRPEKVGHKTSPESRPSASMPSMRIPAPPLLHSARAGNTPDHAHPIAAPMKGNPSTFAPVSAPSSASPWTCPSTFPWPSSYSSPPVGILLPARSNSMSRRRGFPSLTHQLALVAAHRCQASTRTCPPPPTCPSAASTRSHVSLQRRRAFLFRPAPRILADSVNDPDQTGLGRWSRRAGGNR